MHVATTYYDYFFLRHNDSTFGYFILVETINSTVNHIYFLHADSLDTKNICFFILLQQFLTK